MQELVHYNDLPPLTLSLSQQARLGELAASSVRIRKRMRTGEGTVRHALSAFRVPSPMGRRTG